MSTFAATFGFARQIPCARKRHGSYSSTMTAMLSGFQCAGCGEWNETDVDPSAGRTQKYVEDCQVCCKPNVLQVWWDNDENEYVITADLE